MRRAAALCALLLIGGCGLQPVYSGGSRGAAATTLASVDVPVIPDRAGFLVRQALLERIGGRGDGGRSAYRLEIKLDDSISGLGVRGDDSISRERRQLRARWQLIEAAGGTVVIDAASRADAGVDVVESEYAVIVAENAALERLADDIAGQIAARVALYARTSAAK